MITIPRSLVRQLRSIYRRVGIKPTNHCQSYLHVQTSRSGLSIRAKSADVVVEYLQPNDLANEQLIIPLGILMDCEGTKHDPVLLERRGDDKIVATWTDRKIPQLIEYQALPCRTIARCFPNHRKH